MRNSKSSEQMLLAKDELEMLWRTSKLNRYFIPISKLPPLGADPRPAFGRKPPHCCPARPSTTRTDRLMDRWASMPSFAYHLSSVSPEIRASLVAAAGASDMEGVGIDDTEPSWQSLRSPSSPARRTRALSGSGSRRSSWNQQHSRPSSRSRTGPDGKEFPHIPCSCCERCSPIPRLTKLPLGEAAAKLVAAEAQRSVAETTATAPESPDRGGEGGPQSTVEVDGAISA
eukprot:gb/GFBE01053070.1/.p1 GENE.gb/GFBE01053070.1/~~gb/GFBE01053070.1/.p1  ORF type:complete len:229 (+),score=30.30 gb/GFBE01053070.1/:1-687(+)